MSILSTTMRSLVNSIILGEPSTNNHYIHHHDQPDDSDDNSSSFYHHHSNHHLKQNSLSSSSSEIMSTITESSNSSIDSGTFDVFDDPDDHFYDEPLLSSFDYPNYFNQQQQQYYHQHQQKHRNPSSSSSSDVTNILSPTSSHGTSSVIESLLLESSCGNNNNGTNKNNHKPLDNSGNHLLKQSSSFIYKSSSSPNNNPNSTGLITIINKPKIRPPKPPRHINPLTGKKLINNLSVSSDLPPKSVCSVSSSASSSGISSAGSLSPSPSLRENNCSPPPLPPPSISKKPSRPPPPIPNHPPKPLRKKSDPSSPVLSQQPSVVPVATNNTSTTSNEKPVPMAVLNRSRSSQGSFYETAFDSKAIRHDNLRRDQINPLSQHQNSQQQHNLQPIKMTYRSNHHHHQNLHRSTENSTNSSVVSFITDSGTNNNSSRSSTASSTTSTSSTGGVYGESSGSSTPKHLDQLPGSLLPRRQPIKSAIHIPRSKSSDVTLSLSTVPSSPSSPSPPFNQHFDTLSNLPPESKSTTTTLNPLPCSEQPGKRNNPKTLSTFSMVKSTTSDSLSNFDFDAGRVLTRTRSNLDSLRLSIQDRNNNRVNTLSIDNPKVYSLINNSTCKSNLNHCNNLISGSTTSTSNNSNTSTTNIGKMTDKLPANRSFRRLNLKLDETRSTSNLSSPSLQSPLTDTRPLDDYDTPWDSNQRLNKVFNKLINTPSDGPSDCFPNLNSSIKTTPTPTTPTTTTTLPLNESNVNNNNLQASSTVNPMNTNIHGDNDDEAIVNNNDNNDKIDETSTVINQLQLNQQQQRKGSNGSTHSSCSSFSLNGDPESANCANSCLSSPIEAVKIDQICKPERPRKLSLPLNLKNSNTNGNDLGHLSSTTSIGSKRVDLNLDFSIPSSAGSSAANNSLSSPASHPPPPTIAPKLSGLGARKKPLLTFTGQPLPVVSEDIDTSLVLEKQGWYHGSITRLDAENLLRSMKEGSYLIRNCESTKQDYSLSLKSVKGFMHMKIVKQSDGFVLGVFSKPFENIPEMVKHYSINKLPIRGAEHMSLLYPVIDQLL